MNIKGHISLILGILGLITGWLLTPSIWVDSIYKVSIGLIIAWFIDFLVFLNSFRKRGRLLITYLWKRNQPVRVTIAYLFRIELNGKYVLINRHKPDMIGYQPIGGAFKHFKEETREIFQKLGVEPCNHVTRDEDTDQDLRVQIRKRKNLSEFLKWFESRKGREVDLAGVFMRSWWNRGYYQSSISNT